VHSSSVTYVSGRSLCAGAKSWIFRYWVAERDPATGELTREPAGKKLIEDVAALIPDHKQGVSIGWILGQLLSIARRAPVTGELSGYALKHLVDEGKISSYSNRARGASIT
jgi:hypothetical protein